MRRALLLLGLVLAGGCHVGETPTENAARRAQKDRNNLHHYQDVCARRGQVFDGVDVGRVSHTVRCRPR